MVCVRFFAVNSISIALFYSSLVFAIPSSQIEQQQSFDSNSWSFLPSSSSSFASKLYDDCERKNYELLDCLKVKVVSLLDRVSRSDVIEFDESISLVREKSGQGNTDDSSTRVDHGRALTENEVEDTLAGDADKGSKLNDMIFKRISSFLGTHSLKIGFPKFDASSLAKSMEEGEQNYLIYQTIVISN